MRHKGKRPNKVPAPYEEDDCALFVEWVHRCRRGMWPYLEGTAIEAKRGPRDQAKLKRLGYRKGTPDFRIILPRGGYLGAVIEAKRKHVKGYAKNDPTPEQKERLQLYADLGYFVAVCWGYEQLKQAADAYWTGRVAPEEDNPYQVYVGACDRDVERWGIC